MRQVLDANAHAAARVLEFGQSKALAFNAGGALRTTIPDSGEKGPKVLRLTSTEPVYVAMGSETVSATSADVLIVKFEPLLIRVRGETHISALGVAGAGNLNVAEVL